MKTFHKSYLFGVGPQSTQLIVSNHDVKRYCTRNRPRKISNSIHLNGFDICCIKSRYYISEIDENILALNFPSHSITIGDEVIKVNDTYCEHLRFVKKYIGSTKILSLNMRSITTNQYYTVTMTRGMNENCNEATITTNAISLPSLNSTANRERTHVQGG